MTASTRMDWLETRQDIFTGEWLAALAQHPSLCDSLPPGGWAAIVHDGSLAMLKGLRDRSSTPLGEHLCAVFPHGGKQTAPAIGPLIYLQEGKLALLRVLRREQVCPAEELWALGEALDALVAGAMSEWYRTCFQQVQAQLEQSRRYADLILRVIEAATGVLDFDQAMHRIRTEIEQVVPGSWGGYYIVSQQRFLTLRHSFIFPYPVDEFMRLVVETRQPQVSYDAAHDPRILPEMVRIGGFRSVLGVPMVWKDEVMAVLMVMTREHHEFSQAEIELIQAMVNVAALTVKNMLLFQDAEKLAIIQERMRLSREIHDELAQILAATRLKLNQLSDSIRERGDSNTSAALAEVEKLLGSAYSHIRSEIFNLRALTTLDAGFLTALREYVEDFGTLCGMDIELKVEQVDETMISGPAQAQVMRIIQEALMNVYRHAGTNHAQVHVCREGNILQVCVEDRGHGFDPNHLGERERAGVGLQVMRERAESLKGELRIDSKPGEGTRITLRVPLTFRGIRL